jgi:uncharacterized membrane protein YtjA (UPF0391 family)
MLHDSVVFLVIALIAAVFGFGVSPSATSKSPGFFFIFAIKAIIGFVVGWMRRN